MAVWLFVLLNSFVPICMYTRLFWRRASKRGQPASPKKKRIPNGQIPGKDSWASGRTVMGGEGCLQAALAAAFSGLSAKWKRRAPSSNIRDSDNRALHQHRAGSWPICSTEKDADTGHVFLPLPHASSSRNSQRCQKKKKTRTLKQNNPASSRNITCLFIILPQI